MKDISPYMRVKKVLKFVVKLLVKKQKKNNSRTTELWSILVINYVMYGGGSNS